MEKYTSKEITSNVEKLSAKMEMLKLQRTELSQNINSWSRIKYWIDMNEDQYKMF